MQEEIAVKNKFNRILITISLLFLLIFYILGFIIISIINDLLPTFQSDYFWDFMGKVQIVVFLIFILICLPIVLLHQLRTIQNGQSLVPNKLSFSKKGILLQFGKRNAFVEWSDILSIEEKRSLFILKLRKNRNIRIKLSYRLIEKKGEFGKVVREKGDNIDMVVLNSDWNKIIHRNISEKIVERKVC